MNGIAVFNLKNAENGRAPAIKLSDGYEMSIVGFGTYSLHGSICVDAVCNALRCGYRMIDTASFYGNEREVGEGIRKAGLPRAEIFVTTKLYPDQYKDAGRAIDDALRKLNIGYIDLMMLHHPAFNDAVAYRAIEQAITDGKVRSAGVSCYYMKEIDDFLPKVMRRPVLVQNEIHPYYQDRKVTVHIQRLGIAVQAWYPLGGRGYTEALLGNKILGCIGKKYGKSPAQIVLRWELQNGVAVIPGSGNPEHIKENISLFDFELSGEDMEIIAGLNRDEKHDWY